MRKAVPGRYLAAGVGRAPKQIRPQLMELVPLCKVKMRRPKAEDKPEDSTEANLEDKKEDSLEDNTVADNTEEVVEVKAEEVVENTVVEETDPESKRVKY